MSILEIVGVIVAYLIGSIPTAIWIGKWFYSKDIREYGSGNAGATNTFRILGVKPGIFVLLFDAFKGWAVVKMGVYFISDLGNENWALIYSYILSIMAIVGHVLPIFAGFRGGKGVASLIGVLAALFPYILMLVLAVFIISLLLTRYVSLSSIIAALSFPIIVVSFYPDNIYYIVYAEIIAIFIPITHRKNIKRLLLRQEKRIYFKKKAK